MTMIKFKTQEVHLDVENCFNKK